MKLSLPEQSPMRDTDFCYGVATAAFQIEGAANLRLASIWDTFCATPGNIKDKSDGLVACDHYHRWLQDVEMIAELGVDAYRFSISWPRVMTTNGALNTQGVAFYHKLLEALDQRNIKAFVTLYHWDLPQYLQDSGGWLNRETAYAFQNYVHKITSALPAKLVHSYATFNEPFCSAYLGYEIGVHAPGMTGQKQGRTASHHLLLAHGLGMQVLNQTSPDSINGIVLNLSPCYPDSQSQADIDAANYASNYLYHWYLQPLLKASYPDLCPALDPTMLACIQPGDMQIIAQPLDFIGLNYYTRGIYRADENAAYAECEPQLSERTEMGWEVFPQGLTDILLNMHHRYPNLPPVYITENGAAMKDQMVNGQVNDLHRINYLQGQLTALHNAIVQGVDVRGYFAWSLMDNFEWAEGYEKRFGIVYVDYATQQRTVKASGMAYRALLQQLE